MRRTRVTVSGTALMRHCRAPAAWADVYTGCLQTVASAVLLLLLLLLLHQHDAQSVQLGSTDVSSEEAWALQIAIHAVAGGLLGWAYKSDTSSTARAATACTARQPQHQAGSTHPLMSQISPLGPPP